MPTFDHQFTAANGTVTTNSVSLTVQEIEDAGVLEILQSPGATLGHWQFLGALLDPSVGSFSFLQPLAEQVERIAIALAAVFAGGDQLIDERLVVGSDFHLQCRDVVVEMLHRPRPENDRCHDRVGQAPSEGEL